MRIILIITISTLLQSCVTQNMTKVEGGFMSGIGVRKSVDKKYPIIFGKLSVRDNSKNLSFDNSNISDFCLVFVGNDPMIADSMFYRYNWPNAGQRANVYKGLFAIQLTEENLEAKNFNIACGTEHFARKRNKILWAGVVDYGSYIRMDTKKSLKSTTASENKILYLGDVEISIPDNATIYDAKRTFLEGMASDLIGDYYLPAIKQAINYDLKVKDNFKETSEELVKILPFVKEDFVFEKSIMR